MTASISYSYTDGFLQLQNALSFAVTEWKLESNGVTGVSHPDVVVQVHVKLDVLMCVT